MTRIAINGLGRIGRAVLKILLDTPELELVAINDQRSGALAGGVLNSWYDNEWGYAHQMIREILPR